MPRAGVVFREAMDSNGSSDDEVVFVPYSKPPPVVIDLDSDSANEIVGESPKKSKKKAKGLKKKKKKKDKEPDCNGLADDASQYPPAPLPSPSLATGDCSQSSKNSGNSRTRNTSCSGNEEPVLASLSRQGSRNAANDSNTSGTISSSQTVQKTPSLGKSSGGEGGTPSSNFEKCGNAQGRGGKGDDTVGALTGLPMAESASAPGPNDGKRQKSKERKSTGKSPRARTLSATQRTNEEIVNFLTTLGIQMEPSAFETPPMRKRQSRKRPPPVAPAPVVQENDSSMDSTANSTDGQNFPLPLEKDKPSTSAAAFVSVSTENTPTSSIPRKKRRRQAISGDFSDFTVSFKENEFDALNTSFQSNLVTSTSTGGDTRSSKFISVSNDKPSSSSTTPKSTSYYDEIIESVAKGPGPTAQVNSTASGHHAISQATFVPEVASAVGNDNFPIRTEDEDAGRTDKASNDATVVSEGTTAEVSSTSIQQGQVSDVPALTTEGSDMTSPSARSAQEEGAGPSGSNDPESLAISSSATSKKSPSDSGTKRKRGEVEITSEDDDIIELNTFTDEGRRYDSSDKPRKSHERKRARSNNQTDKVNVTAQTSKDKGNNKQKNFKSSSAPRPSQAEPESEPERFVPHEPYYPTTWSSLMRDFYGSIRNDDLEWEDVQASMRSSRRLWEAPNDMMPPPRKYNRGLRCDNCKQYGHLKRSCTEKVKMPTCHYCGKTGHTSDSRSSHRRSCPGALCLNCGQDLPRYASKCGRCLTGKRSSRCEICNVLGHDERICPDTWRRYHSVTTDEEYKQAIVKPRPSSSEDGSRKIEPPKSSILYKRLSSMYCANCGRRGHSYYDCKGSKFNSYPRYKPTIINEVVVATPGTIPISYDSRTGRTFVVEADKQNQPEIAVETIQVKITNEFAFNHSTPEVPPVATVTPTVPASPEATMSTKPVPSTPCKRTIVEDADTGDVSISLENSDIEPETDRDHYEYKCENAKCSNKLDRDEKCYVLSVSPDVHFKLLTAYRNGKLKPLDRQHQVGICVINDNCRIHIVGDGILECSNDMVSLAKHRMDIMKVQPGLYSATAQDNPPGYKAKAGPSRVGSEGKKTIRPQNNDDSVIEIFTVDEDDDDLAIVDVIEPQRASHQDRHENSAQDKAVKTIPSSSLENSKPEPLTLTPTPAVVTATSKPASSSFLAYVSPLTGFSFSNVENEKESYGNTSEVTATSQTGGDVLSSTSGSFCAESSRVSSSKLGEKTAEKLATTAAAIGQEVRSESFEFDDVEEIDYAGGNFVFCGVGEQTESHSQPDSINIDQNASTDLSGSKDVEIITLEDDEDSESDSESGTSGHNSVVRPPTPPEESVLLLLSDWESAMPESLKDNSIFHQIAEAFNVRIHLSKEASSLIIAQGTIHDRKKAKREVEFWLESKCLGTDYHFAPPQRKQSPNQSSVRYCAPADKNSKKMIRQNNNNNNQFTTPRKRKGKKNKNKQSKFNGAVNNNSGPSPSRPPQASLEARLKEFRRLKQQAHFVPRGRPYAPSPKTMRQQHDGPANRSRQDNRNAPSNHQNQRRRSRYFETSN